MTGLRRRQSLRVDPAKQRAWQTRGAKAYAAKPRKPLVRRKRARNDAAWRAHVLVLRGEVCVACGDTRDVQVDHIWPRSQRGPSHPLNGLPLCGEFSSVTPGGCHPAKTASRLRIDPAWLLPEQITWLADVGWVRWDTDGQPHGRGWRHFQPRAEA